LSIGLIAAGFVGGGVIRDIYANRVACGFVSRLGDCKVKQRAASCPTLVNLIPVKISLVDPYFWPWTHVIVDQGPLGLGRSYVDSDLDGIWSLAQLEEFRAPRSRLTDAGVKKLVGLEHLRVVDVSDSDVSDLALEYLAKLPALEALVIERTRITDAGLAYLSDARALLFIDVRGAAITDRGIDYILRIPNLDRLSIMDTRISPAGVLRLREADIGLLGEYAVDPEPTMIPDGSGGGRKGTQPSCPVPESEKVPATKQRGNQRAGDSIRLR
jgi:hypothetical protein